MTDELNLRSLLDALPDSPDKMTSLTNLRTTLSVLPPTSLIGVVQDLPFTGLFEYLRSNDADQISLCCEILERLLVAVDVGVLLERFSADLTVGLSHWSADVRTLCLNQVNRAVEKNIQQVVRHADIVMATVQRIGDESLAIAQKAIRVCTLLGGSVDGLELMLKNNQVFSELQALAGKDDVIRYRVYEMIVNVSSKSSNALEYAADSGLLPRLVAELGNESDVLLRLNCLELVTLLANSRHGLAYLDQQGVLTRLERTLSNIDSDPFGPLIFPGIVKFFGNVCHVQPNEISGRFRPFFNTVFASLENEDLSELTGITIQTIGLIGQSAEGKLALEKLGSAMPVCCKRLGRLMTNAPTDLRVKSLEAVRLLLHVPVSEQTNEVLTLTEAWFSALSPNDDAEIPLKTILSIAKQPFLELHLASLGVIQSLVQVRWGQQRLSSHPGFNEYLLDRSTEVTKEGVEEKYTIVRMLAASPTAAEVFGWDYMLRLKTYEREGAFYAKRESQVATDNAD